MDHHVDHVHEDENIGPRKEYYKVKATIFEDIVFVCANSGSFLIPPIIDYKVVSSEEIVLSSLTQQSNWMSLV